MSQRLTAHQAAQPQVKATSVDQAGVKSKMKVLVGTDVTDNYVMIGGGDEKDYEAKKSTIDAVWGSFEMWSGVR